MFLVDNIFSKSCGIQTSPVRKGVQVHVEFIVTLLSMRAAGRQTVRQGEILQWLHVPVKLYPAVQLRLLRNSPRRIVQLIWFEIDRH